MKGECEGGGVWEYTKSLWILLCSYRGIKTHRDANHSRGTRFSFKVFMPVVFPFSFFSL